MDMALWRTVTILLASCSLIMEVITKEHDWTDDCPISCRCKWISGRKTADCSNSQLISLPSKLSSEVQSVDLSSNQIYSLMDDAFTRIGLANLQKIYLKECQIREVHKDSFRGLKILIELDLSSNQIHIIYSGTFKDNEKLRMLYLSNNPIEKLEDGLFSNHTFLQTVELSDCMISYVGHKTFTNVPVLSTLKLDGNQLTHLKVSTFESLKKLNSLEIRNNPWNCDCRLRAFRDWIIKRNLYTLPTTCREPPYLQNQLWNSVESDKFACKPEINWPTSKRIYAFSAESVTMGCRISGDPKPTIHWVFNSRVINNNTQGMYYFDNRYSLLESQDGRWLNLTISKVRTQDEGDYSCVATSPGGIDERNITLYVRQSILPSEVSGDIWLLLICLVIGIICALILLFILCCICCRKNNDSISKKPFISAVSNGDISHHSYPEPDHRKTLLTTINPVQKPPRKYGDSSPQSETAGTELTELNRNLLDEGSINGAPSVTAESIEEHRSTDSTERLSSYCQEPRYTYGPAEKLKLESSHPYHPPDLLAFPSREIPSSPAGSYASNDLDGSRISSSVNSPMQSPIYQAHSTSSYGTLPYNRSQSPFSPTSSGPVISQRQGYVTIPRRPRIPSWSSAPTPTLLEDAVLKTEPVYDNLGPRTTADGSSVLSLPRSTSNETPNTRNRPLPQTPLYSQTLPHTNKLSYNPHTSVVQENQTVPSPVIRTPYENTGVIRPLPLNESQFLPSEDVGRKTSTSKAVDKRRTSWSNKNTPETGILKRPAPITNSDRDRLITSSPVVPIVKPKVPPKPMQKPKKNGPLFEDEGEDGTEV